MNLTNPRINQVKDILKPTEYAIDDDNLTSLMSDGSNVIDRNELFSQVQASSYEISSSLIDIGVVETNNKVKLIAQGKYRECVRYLLDTILENSWPLDNIDEDKVIQYAPHIDILLLRLVLGKLGSQSSISEKCWILLFDKVAKASAHDLFITHTKENPNKVPLHKS